MKEADRFPTDDITWCWSDCVTDCPRQPKYIRDDTIPHSFADFSSKCVAYTPKEYDDEEEMLLQLPQKHSERRSDTMPL